VRRAAGTLRAVALAISLALIGLHPAAAVAEIAARIDSLVSAGVAAEMHWPRFDAYQGSVREFYAPAGWAPAWVSGTTPTAQAVSLMQLLRDAWQKGLEPEDYDGSRWQARTRALGGADADVAAFDVMLTVCAMRYVSDLRTGRVNPRHVDFGLSIEDKRLDLAQFLRTRLLAAADVPAVIASIEPPFATYRRTEQALLRYVELARRDDGVQLPVPAKPVEPGQSYAGLARLAQLLHLLGDLPDDAAGVPAAYEGALIDAVKRFQRRHGLDDDGRLGPATLRALNVPLADRVRQIGLTLERWRWLPTQFAAPPIVVNIPDFRLRALEAHDAVALEMRVVVGKAMRTETPVFSRDMTYVVFRPYWVVPPGIMRRQIVPAIEKDPTYIATNRYEITTPAGAPVTSAAISAEVLAQLKAGRLMVRQRPGPKNALGLVKLMFPNEHHVYLHSTPATELFARTRRDFSSGCIRVEKPAELTAWVLRNNPGWTLARVEQAMESGRDDVAVTLKQRVPVLIVYGTAIAYGDGEVHFYDDLYGHDARLAQALAKAEAAR